MNVDFFLKTDQRRFTPWTVCFALLYALLTFLACKSHEPWMDEVQPWIAAQSSSWSYLIFEHPHWDAHPVLWHLILKIVSFLFSENGLPIAALLMGWLFAAIVIFYSGIPLFFRIGFLFSYFFFYQYPIVARSYVLYPILFWLLFNHWEKREAKPYVFALILSLIASVSVHGMILIPALIAVECIESLKKKEGLFNNWKKWIPYAISGVVVLFWMTCLWPSYQPISKFHTWPQGIEKLKSFLTIFFAQPILSVIAFAISSYLMIKKEIFLLFIIPITLWILFFFAIYYAPWHEGIIYAWWALCVMKSLDAVYSWSRISKKIVSLLFILIFAVQLKWSFSAWSKEMRSPYSGSKALAEEIFKNHWENESFQGFGDRTSTMNYYFKRNLFENAWKPEKRYYSWNHEKDLVAPQGGIVQGTPQFIISSQYCSDAPSTEYQGYEWIGCFDGTIFWKDTVIEGDIYDLYRRVEAQN